MPTKKPTTNITPAHRAAFNALRSEQYSNFALFSCFLDGEPTSAIIAATLEADGQVTMTPLFVAVTPRMTLTDHDGTPA